MPIFPLKELKVTYKQSLNNVINVLIFKCSGTKEKDRTLTVMIYHYFCYSRGNHVV